MMRRLCHLVPAALAAAMCMGGCSQQALSLAGGSGQANYTILLYVVGSQTHNQDAETYKKIVEDSAGWKDLYIVHKAGWSELYRGRYATQAAAERDLAKARAYRSPVGAQPFVRAMIMPLPGENVGPPEWNMTRTHGLFTVVVAEFYDVPESGYVGRENFAVECCRMFREKGLEAYYYHGPVKSLVGIGSFPESSYPSVIVGGRYERVVRDSRITDILKQFPNLAVNGREEVVVLHPASPPADKISTASYIMEIPRD